VLVKNILMKNKESGWRKLHKGDVCLSLYDHWINKSKKLGPAAPVAHTRETKKAHRIVVEKPEGRYQLR
jgi:hypothetical protein